MEKKKEIGKLLELLNEYEFKVADTYNYAEREATEDDLERLSERIISKKYGFINWLVENDKIDTRNLPPIKIDYDSPRYIQDDEEILLMLLSISDTPIEDLISYLK